MPGKAAKVVITERQQEVLLTMSRSVTIAFQLRQRARIILLGFVGRLNSEIEDIVGLGHDAVGRWQRRSEDIPEDLKPVITKDVLHRDYCPQCRKRVEPKLPDVLPNCTLGNRTLVLPALLHFLQGLTISQVVDTFNFHLRMKVTPGGLVQRWRRLAELLFAWYEQRLQPQRAWCLDPVGADVRLSHLETPQPPGDSATTSPWTQSSRP